MTDEQKYRVASEKLQACEEKERQISAGRSGKLSDRMGDLAEAKMNTASAAAEMARVAERMGL